MIHLLLILPLISASYSPPSGCEFLRPLADFDIVSNQSVRRYQNGTFNIPMQKISSGERLGLCFNDDEVFYWNSIGEKKTYKKEVMEPWELSEECECMSKLSLENPDSKFIKRQEDKICSQFLCFISKDPLQNENDFMKWCEVSKEIGSFLTFLVESSDKKLKKIS